MKSRAQVNVCTRITVRLVLENYRFIIKLYKRIHLDKSCECIMLSGNSKADYSVKINVWKSLETLWKQGVPIKKQNKNVF